MTIEQASQKISVSSQDYIESTDIPDVKIIRPIAYSDNRGFVAETLQERRMFEFGIEMHLVQENISVSLKKGTVRGLHFQLPPHAQAKLIRCVRGRIYDVAVDIRHGSPTYGQYVGIELSGKELTHLYIPAGFAHGFCTLEDNTEVNYKMSDYYSPGFEAGIIWNDPKLKIDWPVNPEEAILSMKDQKLPQFAQMPDYFNIANFPTQGQPR